MARRAPAHMVGSCACDPDVTRPACEQATAVLKGRVSKKQGLSRHYPAKAQSFDCMASLLAACDESTPTLVLSKSHSRRALTMAATSLARSVSSKSPRSSAALRRTTSSATVSCCTAIHERPEEESSCSEESELCSALQTQATLQSCHFGNTVTLNEQRGSDASSSLEPGAD